MNPPEASAKTGAAPAYAWYVVAVLMIAYVFSFIDRQILNLLVAPIRRDLTISDTRMSLLMGFSFAVFYTICGIPLGRLADHKSRRGIIAAGIFFWSVMMGACGLARQYWQFFLARAGVGVGEATLSPSAYSLIADYFPPERRSTALSVYSMGIYIGAGLAFLLGGLIIKAVSVQGDVLLPLVGATRPWQLIFYILGGVGAPFALVLYTVREPLRRGVGSAAAGSAAVAQATLRQCFGYMRRNWRTLACHNVGFGLLSLAGYASLAWVPSFFVRTYGWPASQAGIVYGSMIAVFGSAGSVSAGLVWLPFTLLFPLMPDANTAALLLAPAAFCSAMPFGVAPAAIQDMMPSPMRAQASAVYLFVLNLIGLGVGPTAVALVTDDVFHDDHALRYSLAIVTASALLLSGLLLWLGLGSYRASMIRLQSWRAAAAGAAVGAE